MFNANNYGYNPYGTYIPQRPMPQPNMNDNIISQPVNNSYKLNGKIVDSVDVVKSMDIPLDGSISYFPTADGSAIVSKQLQNDGTSKVTIFKPIDGDKKVEKYATIDMIPDLDEINEEIQNIKKELKDLKKKKKDD